VCSYSGLLHIDDDGIKHVRGEVPHDLDLGAILAAAEHDVEKARSAGATCMHEGNN